MIGKNLITLLLLWTGLLLASLVSAQDEATATDPADEKVNKGSQETEYSDDNYRRFMELKDQPTRTSTLPTNSYQSGTEKLDELPESSQKHLRNQLREIILESDEWAPGDENGEYPFAASEAGEKNSELKQQEAEAWGELVGKYHEREAQIYANAERSDSAAGTDGGQSGSAQAQAESGESAGSEGSNTGEDAGKGVQKRPGQEGQSAQTQTANNGNEGSDSSSASANAGDPNAISTAGVSQSALEYLTGGSQQPNQQQAASSETGQPGSPSEQSASQQSAAQQTASQQAMPQQQTPAESAMAESQSQSQQQSAQQQNSEQQDQQQATQQDASEFVVISKGTLSIKELQNAKGITISTGGNSIPEPPPRKKDDG
jgi:hypothetical protein